jgi:hypothetical protein
MRQGSIRIHFVIAIVPLASSCLGGSIANKWVTIHVNDKTGSCKFVDRERKEIVVDQIAPLFDGICTTDETRQSKCGISEVGSGFDTGKKLTLISEKPGELVLKVGFTLYANHSFIDISWAVKNLRGEPVRVKHVDVLNNAIAFRKSGEKPNLRVLDGNGGKNRTRVSDTLPVECHNNLLVTFGKENSMRRSIVVGGLTYHDYQKWTAVDKADGGLCLRLFAPDAIGKRIDPGETYESQDRFYVDFITDNPFEALEKYAFALRTAQKIDLNMYTFPTVCMWYVNYSRYGGGQTGTNDTPGAVAEMENIVESGFLKYSKAAVRLVPDCYAYNNQQGWWDDEHWAMYGSEFHTPVKAPHYKKPYETTEKWAGAVRALGGIPLTYFQTNWRSEDYAQQFPEHMLYDKSLAWRKPLQEYKKEFSDYVLIQNRRYFPQQSRHPAKMDAPPDMHKQHWRHSRDRNALLWGYDFTDPDFKQHMREVYGSLREAGVAGLMFDYPYSAWVLGGLEDPYATQGSAYRNVFELAYEGLGPKCWIHERCTTKGSDMALGIIASQRTMGDNDRLSPRSVNMGGLRWYKNRVVVNFDADSKGLQYEDRDKIRRILTMTYVTQGRLLLATSFAAMSDDTLFDLTRTFPYHSQPQSARPVDAFLHKYPNTYDFAVNDKWHQLTLYNESDSEAKPFNVQMSGDICFGAIGLDPAKEYYVYDFWNDRFVGRVQGSGKLEQELRPNEARMLAIHAVEENPQFISTDRHIMQGYIDLKNVEWDGQKEVLSGTASVIADDPYTIVIALNGSKPASCSSDIGQCALEELPGQNNLVKLRLSSNDNAEIDWRLKCKYRELE